MQVFKLIVDIIRYYINYFNVTRVYFKKLENVNFSVTNITVK